MINDINDPAQELASQKRLRILFVQAGLQAGGAEKVINLVASHYSELGHDVTVVALSGSATDSFFTYPPSIRIVTMNDLGLSGARRVVSRVRFLRKTFKSVAPDVIISFLTKVNVMSLLAGFGLHPRIVIAERNNPVEQNASWIWYRATNLLGNRAARIVLQTVASLPVVARSLRNKVTVIPNPVAVLPSQPAINRHSKRFVAVGRLEKQKGFDLLLEAFVLVAGKDDACTLTIFGQGPELGALQAQANMAGLANRVSFPGVTNRPGAWVNSGDIFVLSSRFEGFPNVLLEAMSFGLPSVAFDCPWGPSEIIENGKDGILVPSGDTAALAAAMLHVLADPEKQADLGRAARVSVKRFETGQILAMWDELLELV